MPGLLRQICGELLAQISLGMTATNIWIVAQQILGSNRSQYPGIVGATDTLGVTVANTWGIAAAILGAS